MTLEFLRVLLFCLIPIGIFILIFGIRRLRKSFSGTVLLEMPYMQKNGQFAISKAGTYSIWQKGELLKKTPVNKFRPHIYNKETNEEVKLNLSVFFRPHVSSFSTGRMEFFTFYAEPGSYEIALKQGRSVLKIEGVFADIIPLKSVALDKYFIQIRASQPKIFAFLSILIILLGAFGIIGGFVLGLMADQLQLPF